MHSTVWPVRSQASQRKNPYPLPPLTQANQLIASHSYLCTYMCTCVVRICCASSFSYRYMQHISTWLQANAFATESPKAAPTLLSQTRQNSYSVQPWQERAHIIVIAAESNYRHTGRCHSLIPFLVLQGGSTAMPADATLSYHCHCCREGVYCHASRCHSLISLSFLQGGCTAILAGATLSYYCYFCREGVPPCRQVPLSHIIVIAAGREYCHAGRYHSLISLSLL